MREEILIVEDQFVEADYLRLLLTKAGYRVIGIAHSVVQARELLSDRTPDMVLLDIFLKGKLTGIDLGKELRQENIPFLFLSANSNEEILNAAKATQPYGFLVKPYKEKDLLMMLEIARYRHEHSVETRLRKEEMLRNKLSAIVSNLEGRGNSNILDICSSLQSYFPFDYLTGGFNTMEDEPERAVSFLRIGYDEYQQIGLPELLTITGLSKKAFVELATSGGLHHLLNETFGLKSCTSVPVSLPNGRNYMFSFYSRKEDTYKSENPGLSLSLPATLEPLLQAASGVKKNNAAVTAATPANTTMPMKFEGIIGESPLLLQVFDLISQVASSDTSVLILGESGTGKEKIADCIHQHSPRKNFPFVKINCAALPATLIESELFGHEKGSFTGALEKKIGKFERADKGTIFLDEIGELPLDLQAKLLRVLQERCIERIGASDVTKVDIRIIAATNRKLEKEVAEGRFRLDLYYRLNVFPIDMPPLRERPEDIPLLAEHFLGHFSRKLGKNVFAVSENAMQDMLDYHWPGNIRELENVMERGVLLAKGSNIETLALPLAPGAKIGNEAAGGAIKSIHEMERDHIAAVLKKCKGKIFGPGGAAELLKIPPTTLISKMKRLGVERN